MLEKVLARKIASFELLDPTIPGSVTDPKTVILDLHVRLSDRTHVDVEMQIRYSKPLPARIAFYSVKSCVQKLSPGDDYTKLRPTVVIFWLAQTMFDDLPLHSIFELRERTTHRLFSDHFTIHLLQLEQLDRESGPSQDPDHVGVTRWARYLVATEAELARLAQEDPIMAQAKQALEELSADPEAQRLALERAAALKFYAMDLDASREEGRAEGRAQGQRKALVKQLTLKFGTLTDE
jgi:predicted transposase/invertase (TIGR01784 family)